MLNTTEILIHIILKDEGKKNIGIDILGSGDDKENKKRKMKHCSKKKFADCFSRNRLKKKKKR